MMRNGMPLFLALLLSLSLFLIGCGDDDPVDPDDGGDDVTLTPLAEGTVGAAGDTLMVPDAVTIAIPVLALGDDTDVTVSVYSGALDPPDGRQFVGSVYNIGPDGTDFARRAMITLCYDDNTLDGVSESELVVYTRSAGVWSALPTSVNTMADEATTQVMHLSDFALTISADAGEPADGVYASFGAGRYSSWFGDELLHHDSAFARFDAVVNPDQAVSPLHPESVSIGAVALTWDSDREAYVTPLGGTFDFHEAEFTVVGNSSVPSMAVYNVFPNGELAFPTGVSEISGSTEGFDIEWTGHGVDGNVVITISSTDDSITWVSMETDNDGIHSFTEDDLNDLAPGSYLITIAKSIEQTISLTGFDPASRIVATIGAAALLDLDSPTTLIGPDGGTLAMGDEGGLIIEPGTFDEYQLMRVDMDPEPAAAPTGWQFVSAAYTVSPADVALGMPATVVFGWSGGNTGSYDVSTITVFIDTGSGWTALTTTTDILHRMALAPVDELGSFAIMIATR